jgi:hypothetical protein
MTITANIDIQGLPSNHRNGWMVVVNDNGTLWSYGIYDDLDKAEQAVQEHEDRFLIKIG